MVWSGLLMALEADLLTHAYLRCKLLRWSPEITETVHGPSGVSSASVDC